MGALHTLINSTSRLIEIAHKEECRTILYPGKKIMIVWVPGVALHFTDQAYISHPHFSIYFATSHDSRFYPLAFPQSQSAICSKFCDLQQTFTLPASRWMSTVVLLNGPAKVN